MIRKEGFKMAEENQVQEVSPAKGMSGMGVAALVLGIVGIVGSWIPILNNISAFIAALGVIFGIIGIVSIARSNGQKGGKGIAIAGTIVSVVAIIVVLATQSLYGKALDSASDSLDKATGEATEEILGTDVTVDFASYAVESKDYGSQGSLAVTVTNKADAAKSYTVHFEAVDASGTRIQDDYVYANSLGVGQSTVSNIFNAFTDDEIAKYQNASFKIVDVSQF